MRARMWVWARVWAVCLLTPSNASYFMQEAAEEPAPTTSVVEALNRMAQAMEAQERHTSLYERVALLEQTLSRRADAEVVLQAEVQQLRDKIPALEEEIKTIPDMRKELAEFEANIEKLVQDYEAKLSALASEVIRLKKHGARRKDLQTLSDGSNVLLRRVPACPEVGHGGMVGERVGEECLYFSLTSPLNWTAAHHHCQELGGDLAAPNDLLPLKNFLHRAFTRGPSLWLGASYQLDEGEAGVEVGVLPGAAPRKSMGGLEGTPNAESPLPTNSPLQDSVDDDPPVEPASDNHLLPSFAMLSDEGAEERQEGGLENLQLALDHSLFLEDPMRLYSNSRFTRNLLRSEENSIAKDAGRGVSRDGARESERDPSVVDFILLGDVVEEDHPFIIPNLPEHSNIEERSATTHNSSVPVVPGEASIVTSEDDQGNRAEAEEGEGHDISPSEVDEAGRQGETRKATMQCMLLQQRESLDYELVGRPCDELHNFVCEFPFTFDNPLRE